MLTGGGFTCEPSERGPRSHVNHVNGGEFICETCERGVEFRCEPFEGRVNSQVNHVNGGRIHIPYHVNHVNSPPVQMVHI